MQSPSRLLRVIAWITLAAFSSNSMAGVVDLATSPLVTGLGKVVSPNIFFILDDSGSMDLDFMPDDIADPGFGSSTFLTDNTVKDKACMRNFGYNTIYYNPYITYVTPKFSDGTSFTPPAVTSVYDNGFGSYGGPRDLTHDTTVSNTNQVAGVALINNPLAMTASSSVVTVTTNVAHGLTNGTVVTFSNLSVSGNGRTNNLNINGNALPITVVTATKFTINTNTVNTRLATSAGNYGGNSASYTKAVTTSTTTPDYYYYTYTSTPATPPSTCSADGNYTKVWVSSLGTVGTNTKQNFANWYSFYRTRMLMMKTASGRAFQSVTDKYRVGFTTISEKGIDASKFLDIKKFDATQKFNWYDKLYSTYGNSYTPLRGALSKAGRYYAGKLDLGDGSHDPVQYSCQKNFTILTTDGFWNANSEDGTYGPKKLDNTTNVGDQDGVAGVLAPYKDNATAQNTLADVAYYYYNTDLRPAGSTGGLTDEGSRIDVSTNNVPTSNADPATHQHMTTFTLGLGLSGVLANPGDYAALVAGTKVWPDPIVATTPTTLQDTRRIDDLWHAAVNGHGISGDGGNLSARDPDEVVFELSKALQSITAVTGSSSAAATSNLQPISGDNTAFIAQFKTVAWTGDVVARNIDVITGAIPNTNVWSAQALLDAQVTRNIYTFSSAPADAATKLRSFVAGNLATEISNKYFNADSSNPNGALTQYAGWTGTQQGGFNTTAMINYIRGVRTNESTGGTDATDLFRQREHVLGDIVSTAPVFVRKPPFAYSDTGYSAYITAQAARGATVYVGSNDGMVHAFDGTTGQTNSGKERWAYIPTTVIPTLYKLANSDYSISHRFYVDGPITAGDAYNTTTSSWSTLLVGGLGGGGKAYYALDVTDPANPKALWEFSNANDADLGYAYGNPVITKRASDGKWVVLFASGYNNTSGDKKGRLYVVDAFTGAKLSEILTTTTADETLSGIARVSNLVKDGLKNNLTQFVYGGDLNGTLWRFDINTDSVLKMADTSSTAANQPITVQPELAQIKVPSNPDPYTVVYFGTGRFLGPNDIVATAPSSAVAQAIYAVKDTGSYLGVLTTPGAALVSQTLNTGVSPRTTTNNAVDWATNNGWYVTTPIGERFNIDPGLQLGTLAIVANIPKADLCRPTGSSVLYQLSYKSGFVLKTREFAAQTVGLTQLQLGGSGSGADVHGGRVVIELVHADGTTSNDNQEGGGGAAGSAVRVSWREIE